MARVTAEQAVEKYRQRTAAATGDWERGIRNVTQSPGVAAAAAKDKWAANTAAAKDKFAAGAAATTLQDWQGKAIAKSSRYSQGTEQAVPKMQTFMREFLPFQQSVTDQVRSMPSTTPEQREARAIAQMRGTRGFRRSR